MLKVIFYDCEGNELLDSEMTKEQFETLKSVDSICIKSENYYFMQSDYEAVEKHFRVWLKNASDELII